MCCHVSFLILGPLHTFQAKELTMKPSLALPDSDPVDTPKPPECQLCIIWLMQQTGPLTSRHLALHVSEMSDRLRKYTRLNTGILWILVFQDCRCQSLASRIAVRRGKATHCGILQDRQ